MSYLEVSRYKKAWQIAQAEKVAVPGNQDYFVYLHIERDTDLPMYVGIGFRPKMTTGGYKFKYVEEEA